MSQQIKEDLAQFANRKISVRKMRSYFSSISPLIEIRIKNNKLRKFVPIELKENWIIYRFDVVYSSLKELAKSYPLPDVTLFLFLWDSYEANSDFPMFVFAKNKKREGQIMVPDFSNLASQYQVLRYTNLETSNIPWEGRSSVLAWRGSTSQGIYLNRENYTNISRVALCELSKKYPDLIDAGFTLYFQGADEVPELEVYRKERLSYEELVKNKYQLWIDGNSASYSDSGWRFFSNSVVLKPDSENIQWYYQCLEPNKHYVPLQANLEDLVEKLQYLKENDAVAQDIAKNGKDFAVTHLTRSSSLLYLYHLIWEYSRLNFSK